MTIRIDLDRPKESPSNYDLYQITCRASGYKTGIHEIDVDKLHIYPSTRVRLIERSLPAAPADKVAADNAKRAEQLAAKQNAEKLAAIERAIGSEINSYLRGNALGTVDYSGTETGQKELRRVASQYNRNTLIGAQAALDAVRVAKSKLP